MGHYYADMACPKCASLPCECPCKKCGGRGGPWSGSCTCPVEPIDWKKVDKLRKEMRKKEKK